MADEKLIRELDHYKEDIDRLHSRTQEAKARITTHEAICEERYQSIMSALGRFEKHLGVVQKEMSELKTLAIQGKFSLKTAIFLGVLFSGVAGLIYTIMKITE
jgi:methionine synthase II (cobalamin-independent)